MYSDSPMTSFFFYSKNAIRNVQESSSLYDSWNEKMTGKQAIYAKNPMPKSSNSFSRKGGSNGSFDHNNQGILGIRYWNQEEVEQNIP